MELIKQLNSRITALDNERSPFFAHYQEISRYVMPRLGRYFVDDKNASQLRYNDILDNTATRALRISSAGMMAGMSSPSRPWFKYGIPDQDLMKYRPVKIWLDTVTARTQYVLSKSNAYRVLHSMYDELLAFGTAAAFNAVDFGNVLHLHGFTAGEYFIASNFKGDVDTLYRKYKVTVAALAKEFGLPAVSDNVRGMYDRGNYDAWVTICHAIEPRLDRDATKKDARNMPFRSVYWEEGKNDKVLRESGFRRFPCLAPRWLLRPGDVYGDSPAMDALGDIKQLQTEQLDKSKAINYQADPPIQVPSSMQNRDADFLPGGVTYYDPIAGAHPIKNAFEVPLDIRNLVLDLQDIRQRINSAFYTDLFLMISQQNTTMTATEVVERHEEKLMALGPVLERLGNEMLDPLVETTFERLLDAGMLPPPPKELEGSDLNIEYISILAQAQKLAEVNNVDQFVSRIGQFGAIKPEALDRLDGDYYVELLSDKLATDPRLIVPIEQAMAIRDQRAKAMAQAQQQAALVQGADAMSKLGRTPTAGTLAGNVIEGQFNRA
ncbi:portal protein [Methylomonas koyamae]|uniref:portal protein n=1 Tax=Methylomonas koyamae TaxID=702114 RepID=UPI001128CA5C|nr:portal protein [Methylomonas koyamae]TPQ24928.1 phage head-tail adapter protein [Methylomonas koyamae]